MTRNKDKGRIGGQFVPLLHDMLDCPAWQTLSHGAKVLYVELKRRSAWAGNRTYLSYRLAALHLKASHHKIREWFAELEHYGFISMLQPGSLGVDGKGKAPHWRLTEKGSAGQDDLPTKDYLRWDGTPFDPSPYRDRRGRKRWGEKQNPVADVGHTPWRTGDTAPWRTGDTVASEDVAYGVNIENGEGVADVAHITKLTTGENPVSLALIGSKILPEPCVAQNDPRVVTLDATEKRLKARRAHNGKRG